MFKEIESTLRNIFDPSQKVSDPALIRGIAMGMFVFLVVALYEIYEQSTYTTLDFQNTGFDQVQVWLIAILLPLLGALFLWKLNKTGWYLSILYLVYCFFTEGVLLFFKLKEAQYFPMSAILWTALPLLFISPMLFCLFQKRVIAFFKLDKTSIFITILLPAAYGLYLAIGLMKYMNAQIYG